MSPHHSDQMSQRSQVSRIAHWRCSLNVFVFVIVFVFVFVFVIVFFLVGSCLLVTLITCLKGHKSLRVLYGSVFQKCLGVSELVSDEATCCPSLLRGTAKKVHPCWHRTKVGKLLIDDKHQKIYQPTFLKIYIKKQYLVFPVILSNFPFKMKWRWKNSNPVNPLNCIAVSTYVNLNNPKMKWALGPIGFGCAQIYIFSSHTTQCIKHKLAQILDLPFYPKLQIRCSSSPKLFKSS